MRRDPTARTLHEAYPWPFHGPRGGGHSPGTLNQAYLWPYDFPRGDSHTPLGSYLWPTYDPTMVLGS